MNEMNFRKLEKLKVPDELMEKLLAIPQTEEEKAPAVIPWWRNRAVIAAASLVLVSVLSLIVYFLIGNKINVPVAVKPASSATEIVWSTDENGETVATEIVIVPDGTQPTESKSGIARIIESIFGTRDNTAPTTAPDNGRGRTTPTTKTSPTDGRTDPTQSADTSTQGHEPQKPTQPPTEEPVEPTEPTEPYDAPPEPTEPPDDPPEPWDDPPDPTTAPEEPTEPPAVKPTEPPVQPTQPPTEDPDPEARYYHDSITDNIPVSDIPEGSTLYIRLIDSRGKQLGDPDWYSDQHRVTVVNWGERFVSISYTPKDYGIIPQRGFYRYKLYNQDGKTVQGFYTVGLNP